MSATDNKPSVSRNFLPSNIASPNTLKPGIVFITMAGVLVIRLLSIMLGGSCTRSAAPPSPRSATDRLAFRAVRAPCAAPPRARLATFLLASASARALASASARACISRQNAMPSSRSQVNTAWVFCSRRFECHSIVLRIVLIQHTTRCLVQ